ncbi:MAG: hypothetical protein JRI36_04420 [Deltaproteobacteria bacterium]|nr:hypothetical protein [Deltaproteobacteria bacterium]
MATDGVSQDEQVAEATIISEDPSSLESENDGQDDSADNDVATSFSADDGAIASEAVREGPRGWGIHVRRLLEKKWSVIAGTTAGMTIVLCFGLVRTQLVGGSVKAPTLLPVQMVLASIDGATSDVFYFDKFLIILPGGDERAYVSLGIAVIPSGRAVYREIVAHKAACRAAIYDALRQAIADDKAPKPFGTELKRGVMKALNRVLRTGPVEAVELYDYTAV